MQHRKGWALAAAILVLALPLAACGGDSEQAVTEAVVVEPVAGTDLNNITLTAKAATRLDIHTAAVEQNGVGTVIPYAAVIYSPTGETWAYVNSKGLTFVRQAIVVDRIDGDRAYLSKGPGRGHEGCDRGRARTVRRRVRRRRRALREPGGPATMMRWIVGSSLKFRYLVVAGGIAMMVFGLGLLRDSPVDVFPEFAQPKVEIQTLTFGLSAEETEELVTVPMEQALKGLPGLQTIRSKSVPALSQTVLLFERGTDVLKARQLVAERVGTVTPTLPTWASPPVMIQPLSSTSRVMKIGLTSESLSLMELSTIAYWKIRARLLQVPGVANTPIWGERLQQMQVQVDPQKLQEHGVSLTRVMDDTANALDAGLLRFSDGSVIGTGGFLETPNQRLNIQHVLPIVTPKDLSNVGIETENGKHVTLANVANLVEDHQPLAGEAVINDGPGLMLIVEKLPWANTLEVTRGVEEALKQLQPGLPGIEIDSTIFRPASFIEVSIDNLTKALLIGALLVVLVLIFFLYEWRAAVISLISIPMSLVAAGIVLYLRDTTINVMVLAGFVIALGVVVDDAIIDVENIVRRLRQHRAEGGTKSIASVVLEASLEVRSAIVYATLIIVAAMTPIFFLTGLTGAFFKPLAATYVLAVAVSLLVALTVTPALCLILLPRGSLDRRPPPLVRWLQGGYVRHPRADHPEASQGLRRRRGRGDRRPRGHAGARAGVAPELQGAGLPDALGDRTRHGRARGDEGHGAGLPRAAHDPRRPQLRLAHRTGVPLGRAVRHLLRRELDQRRPEGRLRPHARQRAGGRQRVPRHPPRRADLPQGADPGGPDGIE